MAHDLRLLAPMIAIAFCLAGSATAILVVHQIPGDGKTSPSTPMAGHMHTSRVFQKRAVGGVDKPEIRSLVALLLRDGCPIAID